jgi:hypothetical protein
MRVHAIVAVSHPGTLAAWIKGLDADMNSTEGEVRRIGGNARCGQRRAGEL